LSETSPSAVDSGRQKLALDAFTRLSKAITTSTAMADGVSSTPCATTHTGDQHLPRTARPDDHDLRRASRVEGAPIDGATIVEPIATGSPGSRSSPGSRATTRGSRDGLGGRARRRRALPQLAADADLEAQVGSVAGEMRDRPSDAHVKRMVDRILAAAPVVDPVSSRLTADLRGLPDA
jgi:hypothetical protein